MFIAVADDHRLMREMLADTLETLSGPEDKVEIFEAGTYDELHALVAAERMPDLIMLDFHMPGVSGIAGVKNVIRAFKGVPVVVVSGTIDPSLALQCVEAGAMGFLPKTVSSLALRNAVRVVLDGEKYIHSFALAGQRPEDAPSGPAAPSDMPAGGERLPRWSEREGQAIALLIAGKTNKQIARELDLQEMTVKTHVRNIYRKLGAVNRADAVRMILEGRGRPKDPS